MSGRSQRLLKETLIYGLGGAGRKFLSFLLFPLYSRIFSIGDYGAIETAYTFALIASLLLTSGTDLAQSYYFFEYSQADERKKTISSLGIYILLSNILVAILINIFAKDISQILLGNHEYENLIQIVSFAIPWMDLYTFNLNLFRLLRKPKQYILITIPFILLQILLNVLLVVVFQIGMNGIFIADILCYAISTIIALIINRHYFSLHLDVHRFKEMLSYWMPLLPVGISAWFLTSSDRVFLSTFSSLESTGIYSAGIRIASIVGFFIQAFRTANLPFLFEVSKDADAKTVYKKTLSYYYYFITMIALFTSLFARPLLLLMSGEQYLNAIPLIPVLAFVFVLQGTTQIVSSGAMITRNTKYVGLITPFSAILLGFGFIYIIPKFHALGAAWWVLFVHFIYNSLLLLNSQSTYPISFEYGRLVRINLAAVLIISLKFSIPTTSIVWELTTGVILCILFTILTPLLSLLTRTEIISLKKQIQLFLGRILTRKSHDHETVFPDS